MATTFDAVLDKAIQEGNLPGLVLLAKDKSGRLNYVKTVGYSTLEPGKEKPIQPDTVLRLASSSKLLTTIAVLQAVEQGLIDLDDDVSTYVPALAAQEVLTGFTWYGKPITKPRQETITLRHLLTHTAGAGYDFLPAHDTLRRYRRWHKQTVAGGNSSEERMGYPLLHEPGEGWTYGSGISWAGKVLEKVSGSTLEDWLREHVRRPLGLRSITLFPERDPDVVSRLATLSGRSPWTGRVAYYPQLNQPEADDRDCMGGEGICASLEDLMVILCSLLMNDEKLLKKQTVAMMFTPQLEDVQRKFLHECMDSPQWTCASILKSRESDWGYGGVLVDGDSHECLKRGTLMWSGMFHIFWWIDRESGVCAAFGTQLLPATDKVVVPLISDFIRDVYAQMNGKQELQREGGGAKKGQEKNKTIPEVQLKRDRDINNDVPSPTGGLAAWASSFWRNG